MSWQVGGMSASSHWHSPSLLVNSGRRLLKLAHVSLPPNEAEAIPKKFAQTMDFLSFLMMMMYHIGIAVAFAKRTRSSTVSSLNPDPNKKNTTRHEMKTDTKVGKRSKKKKKKNGKITKQNKSEDTLHPLLFYLRFCVAEFIYIPTLCAWMSSVVLANSSTAKKMITSMPRQEQQTLLVWKRRRFHFMSHLDCSGFCRILLCPWTHLPTFRVRFHMAFHVAGMLFA